MIEEPASELPRAEILDKPFGFRIRLLWEWIEPPIRWFLRAMSGLLLIVTLGYAMVSCGTRVFDAGAAGAANMDAPTLSPHGGCNLVVVQQVIQVRVLAGGRLGTEATCAAYYQIRTTTYFCLERFTACTLAEPFDE